MCGIVGAIALNENGKRYLQRMPQALATLNLRGPDFQSIWQQSNIALGHARLSIIDLSAAGQQPMHHPSGQSSIVFNGEFYNFQEHRAHLETGGTQLTSHSDTEVLLHLLHQQGEAAIHHINGFFAFGYYNQKQDSLLLVRDRLGIKPLVYYKDEDVFLFASELKALLAFQFERRIDQISLFNYLKFNYIPGQQGILKGVNRLKPGHVLRIKNVSSSTVITMEEEAYYEIPRETNPAHQDTPEDYAAAQAEIRNLLNKSVELRMVSDVPLGSFLSGGIDSSIIAGLAAQHTKRLQTFSIGYKDQPFFDETHYANSVAKKFRTEHTVFSLSNDDLFEELHSVLDYIDEPFADSSALAVYILSKRTKKHVTVALSGDGADELFSGYNKHQAEYHARNMRLREQIIKLLFPVFDLMPQSRNSKVLNIFRKLRKFSDGLNLTKRDRYWRWAGILTEEETNYLIREHEVMRNQRLSDDGYGYMKRKDALLRHIRKEGDFNDVLYTDMQMVLPYDMLHKVDMMSMANSLEVRTPFMDYRLVNYVSQLPPTYKINGTSKKRILQDAFRSFLPAELYRRPKKGFEVPLHFWFNTELKSYIETEVIEPNFIEQQNLFNPIAVEELRKRVFSNNPGDSPATIWALIVFQHWYKKYMI